MIEKLYIDSKDRNIFENSNNFTINLPSNRALKDVQSVFVDSMCFANTLFPINENSNTLYCNMRRYSTLNDIEYENQYFQAVIPAGSYNPDELIAILPTLIHNAYNDAFPSNPTLAGLEMSYSTTTGLFSFLRTLAYGNAQIISGLRDYLIFEDKFGNFPKSFFDSLNFVIGHDSNNAYDISKIPTPGFSLPMTSTAQPRLSGENYLYLHSDMVSSSESSTGDSSNQDILYKINLYNAFGDIGYYTTGHSNSYVSVNSNNISSMRFYLTNSRDEPVSINGGEYSFILGINY